MLSTEEIDWLVDAYTRGVRRRRADVGLGDGGAAERHGPPGDPRPHAGDDRLGGADVVRGPRTADRRQALDRRRRRQDHAAARPARRRVRRRGAAALRPRARPHRRHARQARVDPRMARGRDARRDAAAAGRHRRRDLRRGRRPRSCGQAAVRPPRHHRHRRGDPADRVEHHVEEDRRGHERARARREVRLRRLPPPSRGRRRARPHDGRPRHRRRGDDRRAPHRHVGAARARGRQRGRGGRERRGARGRRPGGRPRAHRGARRARCSRSRGCPTPIRPRRSTTAAPWTSGGG